MGVLLIVAAALLGIILQCGWGLLASQRPAEVVSQSTSTQPDGTVVHMTGAVGYQARFHWGFVAPLFVVFVIGVVCLYVAGAKASGSNKPMQPTPR
jgi:hypothetical protein